MRTRILVATTAALLAGTVFATAQSVQSGSDREKAGASQGQTMQRPAGKESAGKEQAAPNRNAQANPAQGQQRGREQPSTSGQGNRDQSLDNKSEGGRSQTQRQPENRQQGQTQRPEQGQAQRPGRTEGQAPREQGQIQRDQERQQGQNPREPERNQQGAREGERGGASVNLSSEQRTKIRQTVFNEKNAPRVGKVDFSVKEGTVVPRSVKIVEVPQVLVDIHPEWRRYKYFIVNEELVIVDPETLRIVAIVEV